MKISLPMVVVVVVGVVGVVMIRVMVERKRRFEAVVVVEMGEVVEAWYSLTCCCCHPFE